ncbi:transmembrane protein 107-like [Chroicocephalus ridibundus]|uniref:transmembrane protein 107-like n=1 Tax=Chroicocephalus ridibundus TaxID=1192867 RepID=UPI002FDDAD60
MPPRGLLVPARFLALTAHLVLLVLLGGDTVSPVRASLPPDFSAEEYARAQRWLWGALGGALGLLGVEFVGFFSGVSMFRPGQSLFSLGAHVAAALGLALALLEDWDGGSFWLLFGLCSVPPAVTEALLLVSILGCRRRAL